MNIEEGKRINPSRAAHIFVKIIQLTLTAAKIVDEVGDSGLPLNVWWEINMVCTCGECDLERNAPVVDMVRKLAQAQIDHYDNSAESEFNPHQYTEEMFEILWEYDEAMKRYELACNALINLN